MTNNIKKMHGIWKLSNAYMPKNRGKIFTCFSCLGGSTMGYKLAGFDVIGCNEIDPKVINAYIKNHHPKYAYNCSIRDLIKMQDLPDDLYNLDILDGSPPCTSFSTSGIREKAWGKKKKFAEGQVYQRLDDLFFEFIAFANKLKPKIVISENVTGIIKGKAKGYVKEIIKAFDIAGYKTQIFNLNAANMGVPQARQRIFFISRRKDLNLKPIKLSFNEKIITFYEVEKLVKPYEAKNKYISENLNKYYFMCKQGKSLSTVHPKQNYFNYKKTSYKKPILTLSSHCSILHPKIPRYLNDIEMIVCSSFPIDMNWCNIKPAWAMGMSVPPFMMQRIALEIYDQWLKNDG